MCSLEQVGYAPPLFLGCQILQAESDVFRDGPMREKREMLKKHSDAAIACRHVNSFLGIEQHAAVERDAAPVGTLETRDAPQQHRFARAGGSENAQRRVARRECHVERELRQLFLDLDFE